MSTSEFSGPSLPAGSAALAMPAAFGRYELTQLLAVGGMAEVFLARSRSGGIDRTCVIKRVLPRYSTSKQFVNMFIDEARITIGLDHQNIVRLFDFGQVDSAYFMALEYVEGCDLVDVLRAQKARGEGLPPAAAAWVARSALRGLHHAHGVLDHRGRPMGIVHRDVSPQNIFLGWNGSVKIGDFGIADARNKLTSTLTGTVKGKFSYMSPEQARGEILDGRSDVWAMGVVLWEMLVGGRLFAGDNPVDTMSRVITAPIIRPSEMRSSVPPELDRIVARALTRDRDARYPNGAEMADDIDAFLKTQPCNEDTFSQFLHRLDLKTIITETRLRGGASQKVVVEEGVTVALPDDPELRRLHLELRKEKNLWTLVDIAERHAELGEVDLALSAARTAAAIFAHRGLLVPAIGATHNLSALISRPDLEKDFARLAGLRDHNRQQLMQAIKEVDHGGFFEHVRDADPEGLGAEKTEETLVRLSSPLFSKVTVADFVRLALAAALEERSAGSVIVEEGDRGDCLFAIGRGRVLVNARFSDEGNTGRAYVAALAEGDFFGEFSLLTRSPRSATVEAATDVVLLRLDRDALDNMLFGDASFRQPLVEFYKERVAELLLARSSLISMLSPDARRRLLVRSEVLRFKDEAVIVGEGQQAGQVFFVMAGEVEVFHLEDGFPIFLDKLREGQFFGEMAALRGGKRSASVRAIGDVELLAIDGATLADVLGDAPDVLILFEEAMSQRAAEARQRIAETTRIFLGV